MKKQIEFILTQFGLVLYVYALSNYANKNFFLYAFAASVLTMISVHLIASRMIKEGYQISYAYYTIISFAICEIGIGLFASFLDSLKIENALASAILFGLMLLFILSSSCALTFGKYFFFDMSKNKKDLL